MTLQSAWESRNLPSRLKRSPHQEQSIGIWELTLCFGTLSRINIARMTCLAMSLKGNMHELPESAEECEIVVPRSTMSKPGMQS